MQIQRNDLVQPIERWAFVLIGALQGFCEYWIGDWLRDADEGGLVYGLMGGLLAAILVGPFVYAISRFHAPRALSGKTALIVAGIFGVLYGLAYGRVGDIPFSTTIFLGPSLAILVTGAINAYRLPPGEALTTRLVLATWSSGIALLLAFVAGALVYILVYFSSNLLQLTGFQTLADLLSEDAFNFTIYGAVAGLFLALLAERERLMDGVVQVIILASRYLFVFLIALIALCLFALTFGDDIEINRYLSIAGLCLGLGGAAIVAGLTGQIPSPALSTWLSNLHRYCWIAIVPLIGFAGAALLERIFAYGLTPERIFGLIVVVLLGLVSLGFAGSAFVKNQQRWRDETIRVSLGATAVFAVLSLTPYLSWVDLSTYSQAGRLLAKDGTLNRGPARYLVHDAGLVGKAKIAAFEADLKDETALAALADIKQERDWGRLEDFDANTDIPKLLAQMPVLPRGTPLPVGFSTLDWIEIERWTTSEILQNCQSTTGQQPCRLYVGDVFTGQPGNEVILALPPQTYSGPSGFMPPGGIPSRLLVFSRSMESDRWDQSYVFQSTQAALAEEDFAIVPSDRKDIIINGVRYGD